MGLQFQTFVSPRKIPMRLESSNKEDHQNRFFKIIGLDCPKSNPTKRNVTKKKSINQSKDKGKIKIKNKKIS